MPVIVTGAGGTPQTPIEIPEAGYGTVTYTAPDGSVWPLTDQARGWWTLADGVAGLGAAPVTLTTDAHPRGGSRLRHVQPQSRTIVWPLLVQGEDHQEFIGRWRRLARAFTMTSRRGPGILEFARPDGGRRTIEVYYEGGFEGLGRPGTGITWDTAVLSLWCEDPYWVDATPETMRRAKDSDAEDFLQPYPSVSSGRVLGATTVTNPGDVVVWPTWVITGPATAVTFTNDDSGESFTLDPALIGESLDAGEQVTVTTDPARVRYQDGANWIGALNWPGATLWGLEPGMNSVTFQLDGALIGSAVDLTYFPRYETA